MIKLIRLSVSTALYLLAIQFCFTSTSVSYAQSNSSNVDQASLAKKTEEPAVYAEHHTALEKNSTVITDPLVRVLVSKGVLNEDEGRSISANGTRVLHLTAP